MYRYLLFIIAIFSLVRCANIVPPVGGERDETPPKVVEENSTPNKQTNFQKQRIELEFDEFVVLEDVFNQVVVSPPLQYRPTLSLKGKTLRIDFDSRDTLRENATYTINFGTAVKDLTEKNPADNLRFVFSTGPYLDSLTVQGKLVDAEKGEPVPEALFMLYDNLSDTVVRTQRPFYFARTDTSGRFSIENVRAGTFKGFALKDANLNYKYDQANELIGFPDSLIQVSADSAAPLQIRMFTENRVARLLDSETSTYGLVKLIFNQPPPRDLYIAFDTVGQRIVVENNADTAYVWYDLENAVPWNLYFGQDTLWRDTLAIPALDRGAYLLGVQLAQAEQRADPAAIVRLNPDRTVQVRFNFPLVSYDTAQLHWYEDTLRRAIRPDIRVDTLSPRTLVFNYPWREEMVYQIELLPGAVRDLYGLINNDTILLNYRVEPRKSFANLQLTIDSLDAGENYVVQLLYQGSTIAEEFRLRGVTTDTRSFKTLPAGEYSVQIITDQNNNGRWDPGNYDEKRQPEPIIQRKLEALRSNWEVEATVKLK
ncbi:MAG: Ig-like domain-containing protein [Saprospiraceae bacterium]